MGSGVSCIVKKLEYLFLDIEIVSQQPIHIKKLNKNNIKSIALIGASFKYSSEEITKTPKLMKN
jgi:hypothetical protein